ncbi:uncharacterized protein LOC143923163 [Arctopsyche grandis]|uniref:uncharacterized protein LOC143923163 n=1 Tax=Arctopsyche grandis TaxID=121162 RepID=UPI00406D7277
MNENIHFEDLKMNGKCRACLSTTENLYSIFEEAMNSIITVRDMIMNIATVTISKEDGFTHYICPKCLSDVITAYGFKTKCEESDKILRFQKNTINTTFKMEEKRIKSENYPFFYGDDEKNIEFDSEDNMPLSNHIGVEKVEEFTSKTSANDGTLNDLKKKIKKRSKKHEKRKKDRLSTENSFKKLFECINCHAIFKSGNTLEKHYLKVHQNFSSYITDDKNFTDLNNIENSKVQMANQIYDSNKSLFQCSICQYSCKTLTEFKKHNRCHTEYKPIFCDECNYRCSAVESLVKHKRKHSGEKPFACEFCPYRATTSYALKIHSATHKDVRPFSCNMCEYTCKYPANLVHHIARKHHEKRDHACEVCGKRFYNASHRNVHMRVHTGEKPYACDKCGLAFSQKSNLEKHVNVLHSDSPRIFSCSICEFAAKSKYTLQNHEKKHSGEKPVKCDMCNYSCISNSVLKIHKKRHIGDANYVCDICDYKCYSNFRLKAHKRKHTGERPYPCDLCDYRAKTDSGLRNHKVSHANEQKYSCTNCLFKTNYRSNLTKHELKFCGRISKNLINAKKI